MKEKRFGEIGDRDNRGSVGQGWSESLRVIRLFPSRSSVAPTTTERQRCDGERLKKESRRRRSNGMRRDEETRGVYSIAVTLLRIMLPRCATVIAQHGVS